MILEFEEHRPSVGDGTFVAPTARVLGQVTLGGDCSVWYGTVLRGDVGRIVVGARTNLQDLTVVHVTGDVWDTHIGADVTVGHRAIIHGCRISDRVLIGMGAVVMDGAEVGSYTLIGAGALVPPGMKVPSGVLAVGAPARVVRDLREQERQQIDASAAHYVELGHRHARGAAPVIDSEGPRRTRR